LIPSITHHLDRNNLQDPAEFSDTIVKTELHEPSLKGKGGSLRRKRNPSGRILTLYFAIDLQKTDILKELDTLEWARRYLVTIEKQQEKDRLPFLKGPFTEEEMDVLKKTYEDGIHLRIIADRLGRKNHRSKPRSNLLRLIFKIATSLCSSMTYRFSHQN